MGFAIPDGPVIFRTSTSVLSATRSSLLSSLAVPMMSAASTTSSSNGTGTVRSPRAYAGSRSRRRSCARRCVMLSRNRTDGPVVGSNRSAWSSETTSRTPPRFTRRTSSRAVRHGDVLVSVSVGSIRRRSRGAMFVMRIKSRRRIVVGRVDPSGSRRMQLYTALPLYVAWFS